MKHFLKDTYRKSIEEKIKNVVNNHKKAKSSLSLSPALPPLRDSDLIESKPITEYEATQIYIEKCKDLDISQHPDAKKRFIEQFLSAVHKKSLRLNGLGLGPSSTLIIAQLIFQNPNFVLIDLSMNKIDDLGSQYIAQLLYMDAPVIALDLRSNSLSPNACMLLFKGLKRNTHLSSLDFSTIDGMNRNRVGTEGCKHLSHLLTVNTTISYLNLSMCGITVEGCRVISPSLKVNRSLAYFDVSENNFKSEGFNALFGEPGTFGEISHINLTGCGIKNSASDALCQRLLESKDIRILGLARNQLGKVFMNKLYKAMAEGARVEQLLLSSNKFGPGSAQALHLMIRNARKLSVLDLSHNALGNETIVVMRDALIASNTLEFLDLTDTYVEDSGAEALAMFIKSTSKLKKLMLGDNKIEDSGAIALAEALTGNKTVVTFSLRSNRIKDGGGRALSDMLHKNHTLIDIDLSLNDFGYEIHARVQKSLKEHAAWIQDGLQVIAAENIDYLKKRRLDYKDLCKTLIKETNELNAAKAALEERKAYLAKLIEERTAEINKIDAEAERLKKEHEDIAAERRVVMLRLADVKQTAESERNVKQAALSQIELRRDAAEVHCQRVDNARAEVRYNYEHTLGDLRVHVQAEKDHLEQVIEEATAMKRRVLRKIAEMEFLKNGSESARSISSEISTMSLDVVVPIDAQPSTLGMPVAHEIIHEETHGAEKKKKKKSHKKKQKEKEGAQMLSIEELRKQALSKKAKKLK